MDEETITALARGLMPVVRECVGEAVAKIPAVMLPSELAVEVASAARLLHELPPIVSRETPAAGRVTRIERDDNGALVLIYNTSREDGVSTPGAQA
jgi:hypothetical protein